MVLRWNKLPNLVFFQERMLSVNAFRRRGNLDKEEEAEGIHSEACQLSFTREGKVGLVSHIC